jgi:hypothetical protein
METQNEYIFKKDGDDKYKMSIKGKKNIFGIIEKEYSEKRTKEIYSIKYFWNDIFQDKKYANDLEEAKEKLKHILLNVDKQVTEIQYEHKKIMTFESFIGGETMRNHTNLTDKWTEDEKKELEMIGMKLNSDGDFTYSNNINKLSVSKEVVSHKGQGYSYYLLTISYGPMTKHVLDNAELFTKSNIGSVLNTKVESYDTMYELKRNINIYI